MAKGKGLIIMTDALKHRLVIKEFGRQNKVVKEGVEEFGSIYNARNRKAHLEDTAPGHNKVFCVIVKANGEIE